MALSLSTELCQLCWVLILTLLLCLLYYPAYPYAALLGCCRIDHQCVSDLLQYKDADSAISKFLHHAVCKYLPQNSAVFVSNFLTLEYVLHWLACIVLCMQLHTASIFYQDVCLLFLHVIDHEIHEILSHVLTMNGTSRPRPFLIV